MVAIIMGKQERSCITDTKIEWYNHCTKIVDYSKGKTHYVIEKLHSCVCALITEEKIYTNSYVNIYSTKLGSKMWKQHTTDQ